MCAKNEAQKYLFCVISMQSIGQWTKVIMGPLKP
jgi:hypothetical protein